MLDVISLTTLFRDRSVYAVANFQEQFLLRDEQMLLKIDRRKHYTVKSLEAQLRSTAMSGQKTSSSNAFPPRRTYRTIFNTSQSGVTLYKGDDWQLKFTRGSNSFIVDINKCYVHYGVSQNSRFVYTLSTSEDVIKEWDMNSLSHREIDVSKYRTSNRDFDIVALSPHVVAFSAPKNEIGYVVICNFESKRTAELRIGNKRGILDDGFYFDPIFLVADDGRQLFMNSFGWWYLVDVPRGIMRSPSTHQATRQ